MKYYAYMPSLVVGCCTLILSKYEKKEEDTTFFSSVLLKLYIQPPYCAIFPPCPPLTSYPCPSFYSLFKTGSLCRGNQKIGRIFFLGHLDLPKKTDAPNYYYDPYEFRFRLLQIYLPFIYQLATFYYFKKPITTI